jgi:hypothetical protein
MVIERTKEIFQVGFFLSKYGEKPERNGNILPPYELKTESWKAAYNIFYESLSNGRSLISFRRTLKNTRDEFDSHLPENGRVGWFKDKKPKKLSPIAERVFKEFNELERGEIWQIIKVYTDLEIIEYKDQFSELEAIQFEEEIGIQEVFTEGGLKFIKINKYERSPKARKLAIKIHGKACQVCGFNFEKVYGEWGKGFIEVHHLIPVSKMTNEKYQVDPKVDLAVLCSNCHRMVHRKAGKVLTLEELKSLLNS